MLDTRRRYLLALLVLLTAGLAAPAATEPPAPDLLLILAASGSMWGQIEGENKIVIARRVLRDLLGELDPEAQVGLVAYGHRREGDCEDVETLALPGELDRHLLEQVFAWFEAEWPFEKVLVPLRRENERGLELARSMGLGEVPIDPGGDYLGFVWSR